MLTVNLSLKLFRLCLMEREFSFMKSRKLFLTFVLTIILVLALTACNLNFIPGLSGGDQNGTNQTPGTDPGTNPGGTENPPVEKTKFTVSFDLGYEDCEDVIESQSVTEGEAAQKPTDPTRDGYMFLGWYLDETEWSFDSAVTGEMTLLAKWEYIIPEYTVSFDLQGQGEIESQVVEEGSLAIQPEDPESDERLFLGWMANGLPWSFDTPITEDITITADWSHPFTEGLLYTLLDDGTYGVSIGTATEESIIVIRPTYEGTAVTQVMDYGFSDAKNITELLIPEGIVSIGYLSFSDCTGLMRVTLPNSLTTIGINAFSNCDFLTYLDIPDGVTAIEYRAFSDCDGLVSLELGRSLEAIGSEAFYSCDVLCYINNLSSIKITIGENNPGGLSAKVIVDSEGTQVWSNLNMGIGGYVVEDGFMYERRTRSADVEGHYVLCAYIGPETTVTIPRYFRDMECTMEHARGFIHVILPEGLTDIPGDAFYRCYTLKSVVIPDSVTVINYSAFEDCTALESVTFGSGLTDLANSVFEGCSALTSISIPDGLNYISDYAFKNCSALASITIPDSVNFINKQVFTGTAYYNNPDNWENGILYVGNHIAEVKVASVSGDYVIREGTASIPAGAFMNCTTLTSIVIPDSVRAIKYNTFKGCTSLTKAIIGNGVTNIGDNAFSGCEALESLTIGNSVTSIGDSAFKGCSAITSVNIPASVILVYEDAFNSCYGIKTVYYGGNEDTWNKILINWYNDSMENAKRYYYSEKEPTEEGNFWHYDESGQIVIWE